MSLSKLRGAAKAPAAIFSNSISPEISAIFSRVQDGKPSRTFAPRKKWMPSRFRLKAGETKRLIVIDEKITYAQAEHSVKDREGKWQTERCIAATDACPICQLPKHNPADKILLTVLDLTPWTYTDKEGNKVEKEFTKREIAIGTKQFPIWQTLAATQGLRGLVLDMTRGHEPLEAGIGVPSFVQKLTEEELLETFGHDEIVNEGKVVKEANADITPFNYAAIHTPPSRSELAQKYGIAPAPGSLEERIQEAQDDQAADNDTPPWENQVSMLDLGELPDVD